MSVMLANMVFLSETKNKATKLESIKRLLNSEGCFVVEPRGLKAGMCLPWRAEAEVEVIHFSDFVIEVAFKPYLFGLYASTKDSKWLQQFQMSSQHFLRLTNSYVVGGEFNDILREGDEEVALWGRNISKSYLNP